MINSVGLNTTGSINYREEESLKATQNLEQKTTKDSRDSLNNPTENVSKAAQTSTDIVVSSGKNLNQIVLEKNNPPKELDKSVETNRDLKSISMTSALGTQADENALPSEVNSRTGV